MNRRRFHAPDSAPHEAAHWQDPEAAANNRAGLQADGRHPGSDLRARDRGRECAASSAPFPRPALPASRLGRPLPSNVRMRVVTRSVGPFERRKGDRSSARHASSTTTRQRAPRGLWQGPDRLLETCHRRRVAGCQHMEIAEDASEVGFSPSDVQSIPSGNALTTSAWWQASMASVVFPNPPAPCTSVLAP